MKRVKFACLNLTIHFQLKEDLVGHEAAAKAVKDELAKYKYQLDQRRVKYKIIEETVQSDDSIILRIKRKYDNYSSGDYLD